MDTSGKVSDIPIGVVPFLRNRGPLIPGMEDGIWMACIDVLKFILYDIIRRQKYSNQSVPLSRFIYSFIKSFQKSGQICIIYTQPAKTGLKIGHQKCSRNPFTSHISYAKYAYIAIFDMEKIEIIATYLAVWYIQCLKFQFTGIRKVLRHKRMLNLSGQFKLGI